MIWCDMILVELELCVVCLMMVEMSKGVFIICFIRVMVFFRKKLNNCFIFWLIVFVIVKYVNGILLCVVILVFMFIWLFEKLCELLWCKGL